MNFRKLFSLLLLVGFAVGLSAQPTVESVLANAERHPRNAASIVAVAAGEEPDLLLPLTAAAVEALPDQAIAIVKALLKLSPKDAVDIVHEAVTAQPSLAVRIASTAIALLPDQAAAIKKSAFEAAPQDVRADILAISTGDTQPSDPVTNADKSSGNFPDQPVRADLVSPSSSK